MPPPWTVEATAMEGRHARPTEVNYRNGQAVLEESIKRLNQEFARTCTSHP
jgi:hypothetical protein